MSIYPEKPMSIDRIVLAFAGGAILLSLLLAHYHSANWLWFTAFVGANLLQSAFTGFCPLAKIAKGLGARPGSAFE
jgi:hypothetical protein